MATNTIAQGDTSEVGLTQIIDMGWKIHRAISSTTWPGEATLEIAKVWATAHPWFGQHVLDGRPVAGIDEMLYPLSRSGWRKRRLAENADKSYQGSIVLGMGFTMSPEDAQALIKKDPKLMPTYCSPISEGEDLNQSPTQTAPRWIINFFDWPEEKARRYPDCFSIVQDEGSGHRERDKVKDAAARFWWRYLRPRPEVVPDDRSDGESPSPMLKSRARRSSCRCSRRRGKCSPDATVVFSLVTTTSTLGVLSCGFHSLALGDCATHPRCGTDTRLHAL